MHTIHLAHHNHIAIATLSRGVTNAVNLELVTELSGALQNIKGDPEVHGLVLTSANEKFFSIGLDIPELFDLGREDFASFYHQFNRLCLDLFTFPKPTVAAITGHAIAGGCILVLCCDCRFIAAGKKLMGLNESKLGVPVPYPADCILKHLVGHRIARDVMDTGEFYPGEKLLQMGLVDEVLPVDQVLFKSMEKARWLSSEVPGAFALIKRNRVASVEAEILTRLEEKEQCFVQQWYSPEARERLKEAMEEF